MKVHVYVFAFVTCDGLKKDRNTADENLFQSLIVAALKHGIRNPESGNGNRITETETEYGIRNL